MPAARPPSRQQLKSAQSLVKLFSGMRGAAMKVGQTLSAVDLGLVPEEIRPEFQEILATLQQRRRAGLVQVRSSKVIEEDLGEKLSATASPTSTPSRSRRRRSVRCTARRCATAATVAVKVQYPGIAEAIHADMQNLRLGLKLLSVIAPGIDTGAIAQEIRERITEELDYELEASNHREMARAYRGPSVHRRPRRRHLALPRARARHRVRRRRSASPRPRDDVPGRARPDRRDPGPLLHQRSAAPPAAQRRSASRQQPVPGRRSGRVHRLRVLQAL